MTTPVFILAGGRGTRLSAVLPDVPKPMAPIDGRPFLEIQIQVLKNQGFQNFHLLTGHLAEQIEKHFGDGKNMSVQITYHQEKTPLGTGGAVAQALRNSGCAQALVLNGDTLFLTDFTKFIQAAKGSATIAVREEKDTSRYGSVEFDPLSGKIKNFREKSASQGTGWINAGAYFFQSQAFLREAPTSAFSIETDLFPRLATKAELFAVPCTGEFLDIGLPETLRSAQTLIPGWTKILR